jgi:hypothetical protein
MNKEYTEYLWDKYPNLYKDKDKSIQHSLIPFGFACGDGWFDLINELSSKLEKLIEKYIEENPDDEWPPRASQIKEKFGSLRCYMTSGTDEMMKIIDEYEKKSGTICDVCGREGEIVSVSGWLSARCKQHLNKG